MRTLRQILLNAVSFTPAHDRPRNGSRNNGFLLRSMYGKFRKQDAVVAAYAKKAFDIGGKEIWL